MTEIKTSLLTCRAVVPLAVMAGIFFLSAQTFAPHELAWWEVGLRKLGHVTEYVLLTAAWWWALRPTLTRPLAIAIAIAFLYACSDEYHQSFVSGRHSTPVDVLIDSVGMTISALLIRRIQRPASS